MGDIPIPDLEYAVDLSPEGATMAISGPDIRTLEGALYFLDYHAPTAETLPKHEAVNAAFKELIVKLWKQVPDGPGKTVMVRAISEAKMAANSAIANDGA